MQMQQSQTIQTYETFSNIKELTNSFPPNMSLNRRFNRPSSGPLKFEEYISLEHRFSAIRLHALRSGEESSPTSSVTNQPTELSTSTR